MEAADAALRTEQSIHAQEELSILLLATQH